ncbi:MAG: radical SAM protein [candidate division WOR-3 bacterium]|nr:MAG: radical SAM protein [candidate division WOR-3 bacterium]
MVSEIQARVILSRVRQPDDWFGLDYGMNLYRGCQHQCIYCDSRSECYGIEDFARILVKANAIDLLRDELSRKRKKGTIGTGAMNDPYMPVEAEVRQTGRALELIDEFGFQTHIMTKSDLVLLDLELLESINRSFAAVSFTITTTDDSLAAKLEPGAPAPSARLKAMQTLSKHGITTGVVMMPILPFIEDTPDNIAGIVMQSARHQAQYIIPALGMTMRDRQRAWYFDRLDELFPGLRQKYEARYGDRYQCPVPNARRLEKLFSKLCAERRIPTRFPRYRGHAPEQGSLF